MKNAISLSALVALLAACSSKTNVQPLNVAPAPEETSSESIALTVDGTLCDRFETCDPKRFASEYADHEDCRNVLFGSGHGVHVSAANADACTADLNASCSFLGADAGAANQSLDLPTSCLSN